jgi:hypothetical protein
VVIVLATLSKQWIDTLDAVFATTFTIILTFALIILSAKYNIMQYTWVGVGVFIAIMACCALFALKANSG